MDDLLLAFYGDDFTGSTDALEGLALNGVDAVLFLEPPSAADLERFEDLDAIGVAGRSRSMTPAEMETTLPEAFDDLAALEPPLVHYKVCSTFDSSPEIGSIGRAIDVAQDAFDSSFVPVSQGTTVPYGRYVAFGNLFAVEDGVTYRIDRHPTMSEHPTTPMHESDLRRHLGEQTDRSIGLMDVRAIEGDDPDAALDDVDEEIVVLDAIDEGHLETIGRLLWERAVAESGPLFAVGSSGLEHHALTRRWEAVGAIDDTDPLIGPRPAVDRLVVMSGSASPVTAAQIDWATDRGFEGVRLDTERLVDPDRAAAAREDAVAEALDALADGDSVVLYSVHGPSDPAIERTSRRLDELDVDEGIGSRLGRQQGRILRRILAETELPRACVAGGDTSGYVVPELGIYALEPLAPTAPGAPLCRVRSREEAFDGLEMTLKGGQTGGDDYFGLVRDGGVPPE